MPGSSEFRKNFSTAIYILQQSRSAEKKKNKTMLQQPLAMQLGLSTWEVTGIKIFWELLPHITLSLLHTSFMEPVHHHNLPLKLHHRCRRPGKKSFATTTDMRDSKFGQDHFFGLIATHDTLNLGRSISVCQATNRMSKKPPLAITAFNTSDDHQ